MSSSTSMDLLTQIDKMDPKVAQVADMAANRTTAGEIDRQYAEAQSQMKEALQIKDKSARETKLAVINATLEKLRAEAPKEQKDLAEAVYGINEIAASLDRAYEDLQQPNPAELDLVARAKTRHEEAVEALKSAEKSWNPIGKTARIEVAKSEVDKALQGISDAKAEAGRMTRKRLMAADFEQSTQQLNLMVDRAVSSIETRRKDILVQVKIMGEKKVEALNTRVKAAEKLEKLDAELEVLEGNFSTEEESLGNLTNGSKEHSEQLIKVSELKRQLEEKRSDRNAVLAIHQSAESFSIQFEIHEKTNINLAADQRVWIMKLKSDKQQREATIKSRLEIMKGVNDMEIASGLNQVVTELDMKTAEKVASAGVAVAKKTAEMMAKQPELVNRLEYAKSGQTVATAEVNDKVNKIIERMRKQYSDFPSESTFGEGEPVKEDPSSGKSASDVDELLS
jgi:hypothetical protein